MSNKHCYNGKKNKINANEITVTDHAAMRWSQRVDPGAKPAPEEIAFLLWLY